MSDIKWKDSASYRRGQTDRTPTVWMLRLSRDINITVLTGHIYAPDVWVMHCHPWFDTHELGLPDTATAEEAQRRRRAKPCR